MTKKILVNAQNPEETRVAVLSGEELVDFDTECTSKKHIKGNIYLARVVRVEPSLQAVFIEYGAEHNGFLPFSEIHPDYYKIPIDDQRFEEETEEEEELEETPASPPLKQPPLMNLLTPKACLVSSVKILQRSPPKRNLFVISAKTSSLQRSGSDLSQTSSSRPGNKG